jgi:NADH-quinone oxidoreductase subunit L
VNDLNISAAWWCFLFPLIGAVCTPVLARVHPKLRDYGVVFFSFLAALCSALLFPYLLHPSQLPLESQVEWLTFPVKVNLGVLVDPLSIVVANVVAWISFVIMVYCVDYMKGALGINRFWMLMNLFIGSMLLLVLANNLLWVFIGWKMVGLCSYGLIGYHYRDEEQYWIGGPPPTKYITPTHAGLKALIVTGVGDLLMLAGMLIIYSYARTLNLLELYQTSSQWLPEMARTRGLLLLVGVLLLAGPVGKSAQFPLQEWLPEAMAGPGPVSALIHAATMVKSGVYLVARFIPIFYYATWVKGYDEAFTFFFLTAWGGLITAFLAATQGMVALELKKALAYSTVSQIGYMMLGLGVAGFTPHLLVGGYTSGIFHLVSHALFKASLFLCAGTVIHAAHSIYMQDMGGLKKYLPYTWFFTLIASLSLVGLPPLPGFWSKDSVVTSSWGANYGLLVGALLVVVLTSFYTTRLLGMVFHGKESGPLEEAKRHGSRPAEGSLAMTLACAILTVAILLMGLMGPKVEHFLHEGFGYNLERQLHLPTLPSTHLLNPLTVPLLSVLCVLIGAVPAYFLYLSRAWNPQALLQNPLLKGLHQFFWERWYIDRFYYWLFVGGILKLSRLVPKWAEDPLDRLAHKRLPDLVTKKSHHVLQALRTDTRDNTFRVAYVLIFLILFILTVLWGTR